MKSSTYNKFERFSPVRVFNTAAKWPETNEGARDFYFETFQARIDGDFCETSVHIEGMDDPRKPGDLSAYVSEKVFKRDLETVYPEFSAAEIEELKESLEYAGFTFDKTCVTGYTRKPCDW